MVKKEIRKNVTQALARLPLASVMDVDQISSALLQAMVSKSSLFLCHCPPLKKSGFDSVT